MDPNVERQPPIFKGVLIEVLCKIKGTMLILNVFCHCHDYHYHDHYFLLNYYDSNNNKIIYVRVIPGASILYRTTQ